VIEITDSEPEDFGDDDLFWTELKKRNITRNTSPHRNRDYVKEDSPMDVDVDLPIAQAGPSTPSLTPDPFPQAPVIHIEPEVTLQTKQGPDTDSYSKYLALILEVIPDVLPEHAMGLIEKHHPTYKGQVAEKILQDLFDDPSYPKAEKGVAGKGKSKRKASELEDVLERPPSRVKIDFGSVDRPKPTGKDYRTLALVSCPSVTGPPFAPYQANDWPCHLEPALCRLPVYPSTLRPTRPRFKKWIIRSDSHPAHYRGRI
jgi:hypothetical protein